MVSLTAQLLSDLQTLAQALEGQRPGPCTTLSHNTHGRRRVALGEQGARPSATAMLLPRLCPGLCPETTERPPCLHPAFHPGVAEGVEGER